MAQYKVALMVTTATKAPRRGEREALRYTMLKLISPHVSQRARRSLVVRRVA